MRVLLTRSADGTETWMHTHGREMAITNVQDAAPILEQNQRIRNELKPNPKAHGRIGARIPHALQLAWKKQYREQGYYKEMTWQGFKVWKLNQRDFSKLRLGGKL